jgi:hypothetical protein
MKTKPCKVPVVRIEKFNRNPLSPLGAELPRRHYFRLLAANGEIVGSSEPYTTARARNATVRLLASARMEVKP